MHLHLTLLQRRLEAYYALEEAPDVTDFVRTTEPDSRESLLISEQDGELEIALLLPAANSNEEGSMSLDAYLQWIEGVSHFVHVAERARTGLPTTRLELELQAEVDKFVLLSLSKGKRGELAVAQLVERLFERVRFLHSPDSTQGQRYREANRLAARFVWRLSRHRSPLVAQELLRRFYRMGQAEKIRLAQAA